MRRPLRILALVATSLAGLVVVLIVAALIAVQTPWFHNFVRGKIVSEVEQATGGRAEVGAFSLALIPLRAEVDNFVLHGKEGQNEPPLFRVRSLAVTVKILSVIHPKVVIDSLVITQPQAYVRVGRDGATNIPQPKKPAPPSRKSPIQTVLDLAVRRFQLEDGLLQFAHRKTAFNLRGENLRARLDYHLAGPSYTGNIAMAPVYFESPGRPRLPVNVDVPLKIAGNGIEISGARFDTPRSRLAITLSVADFAAQRGNVRVNGRLAVDELVGAVMKAPARARHAPMLELNGAAALDGNELKLAGVQLALGSSTLDASGVITDVKQMQGAIRFNGNLALAQLGRFLAPSLRPEGTLTLGGQAQLAGANKYHVTGKIDAVHVAFLAGKTPLRNLSAVSNVDVTPTRIALDNLRLNALGGGFTGRAELVDQKTFRVDGTLKNFDLHQLAQGYARRDLAWDGILSGPVRAEGSLQGPMTRQLVAGTQLSIRPGPRGIPLSGRIDANYDGPRDTVSLGTSYVALPHSRLDLSGTIGAQLRIRLVSHDLDDFLPALAMTSANPPKTLPVSLAPGGEAGFEGTVTGSLSEPVVAGHAALTSFLVQHHKFDKFAADLNAAKDGASVRNAVLTQGPMQASLNASVGLKDWKTLPEAPVSANASLRSAKLQDLLALAGQQKTPASGTLTIGAQVSGTIGNPNANADATLSKGVVYGEPFDAIRARIHYANQRAELKAEEIGIGHGRVELNASFQHPPQQFSTGRVQFHLASTPIPLQNLHNVAERQSGLTGIVQLLVDGAGDLVQPAPGKPLLAPTAVNANLSAKGLAREKRRFGDLTMTAQTRGQNLDFHLQSDLAGSNIHGDGTAVLAGDYPVNVKVSVSPVRVGAIRSALAKSPEGEKAGLDGIMEGMLTVSGPAMRWQELKGSLELPQVRLTAAAPAEGAAQPGPALVLHNPAPVVIGLDRAVVHIQDARLVGNGTDFAITGTVDLLHENALDIHAKGDIGLAIMQSLDPDLLASGDILLNAAVKGRMAQPAITGRLELKNAAVNSLSSPNGLWKANGVIRFNGTQALIENLTGESGGGKVSLAGSVRYGGVPAPEFRIQGRADRVRLRSGNVSAKINAGVELAGTTKASLVSGNVSILDVAVHSHTDFGSMLSQGAPPASEPAGQTGLLSAMRLDVRIDTAPNVQFQTGLTQNLQAIAHLRLRGTPSRPGMLGRVNVTEGQIVFFGSKYTINRGAIDFFDPARILPVLDVALGTKAKGVDVTLLVSGPIDKLKLTYHADPPMQFSDVVQLLATGKMASTDPVLAAQQPAAPQQNLEQMGASAVLSQAVANPVSGRLQRLFGVTKLKIDPQIIGPENTPQARMTMEQQITRDLAFTYITDVNRGNPQVVRIEWAIDPTWSAVALRQDNGQVGVDLYYKLQFK